MNIWIEKQKMQNLQSSGLPLVSHKGICFKEAVMIEALKRVFTNLSHFLSYIHFFNTPSGNNTINNLKLLLISTSIQSIIGPYII